MQDAASEDTAYQAVRTSLEKLQLEYVDLVLLHQPMGDYFAAWRGLEKALGEGLVRAIGVSNFYPAVLANFCQSVNTQPTVNQVEIHPFFTQELAVQTMQKYQVVPQAWGPLAEGKHGIFTDPDLTKIGEKYGKTPAQVALRWQIQRGVSVLPKSVRPERIAENFNIFDFELTDQEMATISAKDLGHSEIVDHSDPGFVEMLHSFKLHD